MGERNIASGKSGKGISERNRLRLPETQSVSPPVGKRKYRVDTKQDQKDAQTRGRAESRDYAEKSTAGRKPASRPITSTKNKRS